MEEKKKPRKKKEPAKPAASAPQGKPAEPTTSAGPGSEKASEKATEKPADKVGTMPFDEGILLGEPPDKGQLAKKEDLLPMRLPLVPLDGRPVIPGMLLPVYIRADKPMQALFEHLQHTDRSFVGFVYSHNPTTPEPDAEDVVVEQHTKDASTIAKIGVAAQIIKIIQTPNHDYQMLIRGLRRFQIQGWVQQEPFLVAEVSYPELDTTGDPQEIHAYAVSIASCLKEISQNSPVFPDELKASFANLSLAEPGKLCDLSMLISDATPKELQEIVESLNLMERLQKTLLILKKEIEFLKIKEKINKQIEEKISQRQREFFLREQLKAIKKELGYEQDEKTAEISRFKREFAEKQVNEEAKKKFEEELNKLVLLEIQSPEFGVVRNYLDWLVLLPWGKQTQDNLELVEARKVLDEDHYGLDDIKDRLIEFLAVGKLLNRVEGSILCFVGPPGVGKTSLGKSIARALGRKFYRFSVGGMHDEAEIKGHRRTYIGALPGKLIQALRTVGTDNPVIMLDEIDKIGKDFRGDPSSALLEVLDPEQNLAFRDHYLDVPYDLSKILFIATANVLDTIPLALRDRMEVIHLPGYIRQEKLHIATDHLIPKQLKRHGLDEKALHFSMPALDKIIELYAREAGVRGVEKQIAKVMRKVAVQIVKGKNRQVKISAQNLEHYLGTAIFRDSPLEKNRDPGVITGLAWTPLGGNVLFIESVAKLAKPFGFKQTGQLGEVMVESSDIAYSYVQANAKSFGIPDDFFTERQIHLHVPAGATPKDGPSAGITMATSLISLAKNKNIPYKIAMTGELTLTGRILPVGGIREKLIAAKRAKVETVLLPEENRRDVQEIPKYIIEGLKIHFVEYYIDVYKFCFEQ